MTVEEFFSTIGSSNTFVQLSVTVIDPRTQSTELVTIIETAEQIATGKFARATVACWSALQVSSCPGGVCINLTANIWTKGVATETNTDVEWVELNWSVFQGEKLVNENIFSVPRPWLAERIGLEDDEALYKWFDDVYGEELPDDEWPPERIYREALHDGVLRRLDWNG